MTQAPHYESRVIAFAMTLILLVGRCALGENVTADILGEARAKGLVVLRARIPSTGEVWRVSLLSSQNGEHFRGAGIGALDRRVFWSVIEDGGVASVLVPAVGWYGRDVSCFDGPGPHWLRWEITYRDQSKPRTAEDQAAKDIEPVRIDQHLDVAEPRDSDLGFISELGEVERSKALLGRAWLDGRTEAAQEAMLAPSTEALEFRALVVIGELLKATRDHEPWVAARRQGPPKTGTVWADTLWTLAQQFPESSYAPYAGYYAGCAYISCLAQITKQEHGRMIAPEARENSYYGKAEAALSFCVERADVYLKPRALYMKAFLPLCAAQWGQAELALNEAEEQAPGEETIREWVTQLRASAIRERERIDRTSSRDRQ